MHFLGVAAFLYVASMTAVDVKQAILAPPPAVVSPDPAPPHPLKPRVPPIEYPSPTVLRGVLEVAGQILQRHGH